MESLALVVAVIFCAVAASGPLAYAASRMGYPYLGGAMGAVAVALGCWWALTVSWQVGWVGLVSAMLGAWSLRRACRNDSAKSRAD